MTLLWLLGVIGVLMLAMIGYVGVRDRRRLSSADDSTASQVSAAEAHRYAAEGQAHQAGRYISDQINGH